MADKRKEIVGGLGRAAKRLFADRPESVAGVHYADPLAPSTMRMSEALGNVGAEGKTLNFTEADRSRVFGTNRGGVGFSALQHYSEPHWNANTVWGFGNDIVAKKKIKQNDPDKSLWTTFVGAPTQHKSNTVVIKDAVEEFQRAVKQGKVHPAQIKLINDRIKLATDDQSGAFLFDPSYDLTDPKALSGANTFARRSAIGDALLGEGVKGPMRRTAFKEANEGLIWHDAGKMEGILRRETDPDLVGAGTYDVGNRLFVMDGKIIKRPDLNEAFPYQVTGEDLGMKYELVPPDKAMRDFYKAREGRLNKRLKPAPVSYYDLARAEPSQLVDEDYLTFLQKEGYKGGGAVDIEAADARLEAAIANRMAKGGKVDIEAADARLEQAIAQRMAENVPRETSEGVQHMGGGGKADAAKGLKNVFTRVFQEAPPLTPKVRPPSDNVANVRQANFSYPKVIGNQTVKIDKLSGGVRMSDPNEVKRVNALADKIASPEGYISRIIVDHNDNVIEGQHRLEALRQLGIKDVPVYKIEDLGETLPVLKMEEAMRGAGGIHSDHVHQLMQHLLDDIAENGIGGAGKLDYGKWQKHYDAALEAAVPKLPKGQQAVLPDAAANLERFRAASEEKRRMYHGSKNPNITEFKTRKDMTDEGDMNGHYADARDAVFVSPEPDFTKNFSQMGYTDAHEAPTTYPVYVRIEKPFDFDNPAHLKKVKETYLDMYHNPQSELYDPQLLSSERSLKQHEFNKRVDRLPEDENNWGRIENAEFQSVLRDLGYDSFYTRERGVKNLGVYEPNRIKSAIGNRGTYDLGESDINKAEGGPAFKKLQFMGGGGRADAAKGLGKGVKRLFADPAESFVASGRKGVEDGRGGNTIIKEGGGNWIGGDVERGLKGLKRNETPVLPITEAEVTAMRNAGYTVYDPVTGTFTKPNPINQFVDKQLTKYVKNQMGTKDDPVRLAADAFPAQKAKLLAEKQVQIDKATADMETARQSRGFTPEMMTRSQARIRALEKEKELIERRVGIHYEPQTAAYIADRKRQKTGFPAISTTPSGQAWENMSDALIEGEPYRMRLPMVTPETAPDALRALGGEFAVQNPNAMAYSIKGGDLNDVMLGRNLGFNHMMDELRNATTPTSGLPKELLIDPKLLSKWTIPQAAEHVDKINAWRASQKAEADVARANNAATVIHKDYPEKGMKWVELKTPEGEKPADWDSYTPAEKKNYLSLPNKQGEAQLADALKYEGELMQHCVAGYCDDVISGRSRIFSLRDAKGNPHATIEVKPSKTFTPEKRESQMGFLVQRLLGEGMSEEKALEQAAKLYPESETMQSIHQIKGMNDRIPKEEYLPYVQDFVKSQPWSDVKDLQNTGLFKHESGKYVSQDEANALAARHFGVNETNKPDMTESPEIYFNRISRYNPKMLSDVDKGFIEDWKAGNFKRGGVVHMDKGGTPENIFGVAETPEQEFLRYVRMLRVNASGGKDPYGADVGGRFGINIPLSQNVSIEPYFQGSAYKPNSGKVEHGGIAGANLNIRFNNGGAVSDGAFKTLQWSKPQHFYVGGVAPFQDADGNVVPFQEEMEDAASPATVNPMMARQRDRRLGKPMTEGTEERWKTIKKNAKEMFEEAKVEIGNDYQRLKNSPAARAQLAKIIAAGNVGVGPDLLNLINEYVLDPIKSVTVDKVFTKPSSVMLPVKNREDIGYNRDGTRVPKFGSIADVFTTESGVPNPRKDAVVSSYPYDYDEPDIDAKLKRIPLGGSEHMIESMQARNLMYGGKQIITDPHTGNQTEINPGRFHPITEIGGSILTGGGLNTAARLARKGYQRLTDPARIRASALSRAIDKDVETFTKKPLPRKRGGLTQLNTR